MNKTGIGIICTIIGGGIGSAVTYIFTKKAYEKKLLKAVVDYEAVFNKVEAVEKQEQLKEVEPKIVEEDDISIDFNNVVKQYHPESLPDDEEKHAVNTDADITEPFYIDPSEFGSEYYDKLYWTVYKDGVIADERDDIVKDPTNGIGPAIMNDLKTMGNDFVYVRNVALNVDIEIAMSVENYADVVSKHPYGL